MTDTEVIHKPGSERLVEALQQTMLYNFTELLQPAIVANETLKCLGAEMSRAKMSAFYNRVCGRMNLLRPFGILEVVYSEGIKSPTTVPLDSAVIFVMGFACIAVCYSDDDHGPISFYADGDVSNLPTHIALCETLDFIKRL